MTIAAANKLSVYYSYSPYLLNFGSLLPSLEQSLFTTRYHDGSK